MRNDNKSSADIFKALGDETRFSVFELLVKHNICAKSIAAIAEHCTPSMVYAHGFAMGIIWIILAVTGLIARIAQILLTVTNAAIATASLIKTYWPEKHVSEKQLAWQVCLSCFPGQLSAR